MIHLAEFTSKKKKIPVDTLCHAIIKQLICSAEYICAGVRGFANYLLKHSHGPSVTAISTIESK